LHEEARISSLIAVGPEKAERQPPVLSILRGIIE
jgi:hypothetical protein